MGDSGGFFRFYPPNVTPKKNIRLGVILEVLNDVRVR